MSSQPRPRAARVAIAALPLALCLALTVAPPLAAQRATPRKRPAAAVKAAPAPPAKAVPVGRVTGVLEDSVHLQPLAGATVRVDGTKRSAVSDDDGRFTVDSVPPGDHEVTVSHPLLDSLYLTLGPAPVHVTADSAAHVVLATPSFATLFGGDCPEAARAFGPAAFAGRVLDADSKQPAAGVRVSLVWMQISVGTDIGVRPMPRVRTATTDARGAYRICGVPADLEDATVQAERGRVKTAEVLATTGSTLGLRSFLVGPASDGPGTVGRAVATGHVADTLGAPLEHAQVSVEGAAPVATTNARGDFSLDSLPSGTQALVVRRIGFAPSRTIVDLAAGTPARVSARLERAVPRLNPVVTTARAEALSRVGFEDRQKRGLGHFLGPDDLARLQPQQATSALRTLPGLRVVPSGTGGNTVQSSRNAMGGCVNFWVDGAPFRELQGGDLDAAFPGNQIAAIESYEPNEVPAQFMAAGQSSCATVVIWTQASIRRRR